ncbi:hypothetical protein EDB86DRAFT_2968727 [Lactarius hatsudake]|nr:hypothetical protein EDB86DRAFT_2968727 [Lactarius hatsudake]
MVLGRHVTSVHYCNKIFVLVTLCSVVMTRVMTLHDGSDWVRPATPVSVRLCDTYLYSENPVILIHYSRVFSHTSLSFITY